MPAARMIDGVPSNPEDEAYGEPAAVVREHVAAFNAHDTASLLAGLTADCVWITGTDRMVGRAALGGLFDDGLWSMDPSLALDSLLADGDRVAAELTERLIVDGEQRVFAIAAFFTVAGARIARAKVYREGSATI